MVTAAHATPFDQEPPPTSEQVAAILREGHTILEAGAGSGKTTTLVDKILYALGADRVPGHAPSRPCELGEIAAITFTNAAAADFKRKLRERMRLVADWHMRAGNAGEERRWRDRVYDVDRARVGTIHSFCGQLLREFGLRVGLDPSFRIADEGEGRLLAAEAVSATLRAALREEREPVFELGETLGLGKVETLVGRLLGGGRATAEAIEAWTHAGTPRLAELARCIDAQRAGWGCADGAGKWRDAADPVAARMAATLLGLAAEARATLDERLAAEGVLDFDAVIARTRGLLADRPDVCHAIRRRLAWLFIDEFQDTDRDQLDIAYHLCGIEPGDPASDRRDAPWLCLVGDPKQSIYRFRGADVSLWTTVSAELALRDIRPIVLNTNFRSRAPILGYVNATFSGLIGEGRAGVIAAGHEVPYLHLVAHRPAAGDGEHVELLAVPADGSAELRRQAEATLVATRIRAMVEQGTAHWRDVAILMRTRTALPVYETVFRALGVPYYIAGGKGLFDRREIRDVRLLLAAFIDPHDDIAWMGVLRSPFVGVTDESLYRFRLAHPRRPFSAMLDAPATEQDEQLRRAAPWLRDARMLRDRVPVAALIDHLLAASGYAAQLLAEAGGEQALSNLRKLVRVAEGRPDASVTEFLAFIDEREEGAARDGDAALYTAGEDVVTLGTVHGAKGLEWGVVFLADLGREIVSTRQMPALYADASAGVALQHAVTAADGTVVAAGAYECLRQRDVALSEAEEKRLWYVAATRARDRLVICAGMDEVNDAIAARGQGTPPTRVTHWLLRALAPEEGYVTFSYEGEQWTAGETLIAPAAAVAPRTRQLPTLESLAAVRIPSELVERLARRIAPVAATAPLPSRSATQLMLLDTDEAGYSERYLLGVPAREHAVPMPGSASGTGGGAMSVPAQVLGTVLHGALERDRVEAELDEYLESALCAELGDEAASPRVRRAVERLRELVDATRAHASVARLCNAEASERELAFTWFARSPRGVTLLRGAMDLVARIDGALEVLDYKSHGDAAGREAEIAEGYVLQRAVYSAALAALTGTPPARFSFFFPSSNGEAVVAADPAEMAASLARLTALLDVAHRHQAH